MLERRVVKDLGRTVAARDVEVVAGPVKDALISLEALAVFGRLGESGAVNGYEEIVLGENGQLGLAVVIC